MELLANGTASLEFRRAMIPARARRRRADLDRRASGQHALGVINRCAGVTLVTEFDPGMRAYIDALAALTHDWPEPETPAEGRRHAERVAAHFRVPHPEGLRTEDDFICLADRELGVRIYQPPGHSGSGPHPTVFYFHGGGWVHGSITTHDGIVADLAAACGVQTISLNYRRAPENPYPAPLEDCLACIAEACAPGSLLGADAARFALAGDSAGGNLAVCAALALRDRGQTMPAALALFYPVVDTDLDRPSYLEALDPLLDRDGMRYYLDAYLSGDMHTDEPYAVPMRARDLSGLPPTWLLAAGLDPLHDEVLAFGARLAEAGVETDSHDLPGLTHAFLRARRESALVGNVLHEVAAGLAGRLGA